MNEKNTFWESAGKAGLALGGVSILYMVITALIGNGSSDAPSALLRLFSALLWLAKLVGCIYLMRFFMLRFSNDNPSADNGRVFRFGMVVALLSALLYSGVSLAYISFINPQMFEDAFAQLMDNPMFNDQMAAQMEDLIPRMPAISFYTNLIYCFLFGTIVSAVFSRNIPKRNPFEA
jgi:hypothetical protein